MEMFLKAAAGVLITVILSLALMKREKDIGMLLTIAGCCMVVVAAVTYLQPVIDFFRELQRLGQLDSGLLGILLKAVGIGLLAEITGLICADAGNAALGKALQVLASAVVLWLSIPLLQSLMELVQEILGEV